MIQRASLRSAPAVLNMGDKAVWVTGWNEAVDALEAEQAQAVEPVAWGMKKDGLMLDIICPDEHEAFEGDYTIPLYTHSAPPPAAPTVKQPLSNDELRDYAEARIQADRAARQAEQGPCGWMQNIDKAMQEPLFQALRGIMGTENTGQDMALLQTIRHYRAKTPHPAPPPACEVPAKLKALLSAPQQIATGPCGQCKSSADPCYCGNVNTGKSTPPAKPTVKQPLSNERAALISWQHDRFKTHMSMGYEGLAELAKKTADMLEADAQQVAVNQGCQYPMCHSEKYQQAVTAQITAELWTGVVVPPGYALVPLEPTPEMIVAGRNAPMCLASASNIIEDYIELYKAMLSAAPQLTPGVASIDELGGIVFEGTSDEVIAYLHARCEEQSDGEVLPAKVKPEFQAEVDQMVAVAEARKARSDALEVPVPAATVTGIFLDENNQTRMCINTELPLMTELFTHPARISKHEPMTDAEINGLFLSIKKELFEIPGGSANVPWHRRVIVRAVEAHHGIGADHG